MVELAPLRREDAMHAAMQQGVDAEPFLREIDMLGIEALASRPLTLDMSLSLAGEGSLPARRAALFERACLRLCRKPDSSTRTGREARAGRDVDTALSPEQRLAVAMRIAAASVLAQRPFVLLGGSGTHERDVAGAAEIAGAELRRTGIEISGEEIVVRFGLAGLAQALAWVIREWGSIDPFWHDRVSEPIWGKACEYLDREDIAELMAEVIDRYLHEYRHEKLARLAEHLGRNPRGLKKLLARLFARRADKEPRRAALKLDELVSRSDTPWLLDWIDEEEDDYLRQALCELIGWTVSLWQPSDEYWLVVERYRADRERYSALPPHRATLVLTRAPSPGCSALGRRLHVRALQRSPAPPMSPGTRALAADHLAIVL